MRRVATKRPNAWGLHDMQGNAFEWCRAAWVYSYNAAPTDGSPQQRRDQTGRSVRGGAVLSAAADCRSAARSHYDMTIRGDFIGFRPAFTSADD